MSLNDLQPGDMVFAAADIFNDGSIPDMPTDMPIASRGTRGVILNSGHLEEQPQQQLFLVRFETQDLELGPAVGCWPHELSVTP